MTIHKGFLAVVVGLAVLAGVGACTSDPATPGGPAGSASGAPHATDKAAEEKAEQRRGGRKVGSLVLGDLNKPKSAAEVGAPFDPCALAWNDFPAGVRPADGKPHPPTLKPVAADDPFAVRCTFDNTGTVTISADGGASGPAGGYFIASVAWGTKLNADPNQRAGSIPKSWGGKAGLQARSDDPKSGRGCVGLVQLAHGVGGVSVTNGRFPQVDPCTVVDAVLNAITARTP